MSIDTLALERVVWLAPHTLVRQHVRMVSRRTIAAAALALALAPQPVSALDPKVRLTQYRHATWRVQDGAFESAPNAITQTADGYIWIGTGSGLVKYDGVRFVPWTPPEGNPFSSPVYSLPGSCDGTLWIGTATGLLSWSRNSLRPHVRGRINSIVEDRKHKIWVARSRPTDSNGGICQAVGEQPRCLGGEDGMRLPYAVALSEDVHGDLWSLDVLHADRVTSIPIPGQRVTSLWQDRAKRLWVGVDKLLTVYEGGRFRQISRLDGRPLGTAIAITEDREENLWVSAVGADRRLFRIRNLRVQREFTPDQIPFARLLAADPTGGIWLGLANGNLAHYQRGILEVFPLQHGEQALPGLAIDADGSAWASTQNGVVRWKNRQMNTLDGRDQEWQRAGTRRQAFYSDLPPGQYRFHVTATNHDGVWNEAGAALNFTIAPAYYQTTWFLALSVATVIALAWTAHRVRLRTVEKHKREIVALNERLMKAQDMERIRIAGELHDGVMQEMLAATMMLGTVKRRIGDDSDAQRMIERVQQKLIQVGTDIRQLSHDLHPPALQDAGLAKALRGYCEDFSANCGIPVSCDADDRAEDLSRGTALALFRIVQEALGNAAKHAAAKRITVGLTRSGGVVSLAVSDDGVGFDRSRLTTAGGLGLITMRERAGQLNGTFDLESAPGRGTTISVVIPFR